MSNNNTMYRYSELIAEGMATNAATAFVELQKAGCPVKIWDDGERGHFWIDAEQSGASEWLDYWSHAYIAGSEKLNQILQKHGLYFEWANSAYAHVYDI
jgi:hypothetical protein